MQSYLLPTGFSLLIAHCFVLNIAKPFLFCTSNLQLQKGSSNESVRMPVYVLWQEHPSKHYSMLWICLARCLYMQKALLR